jgi:hypothetical protein
MSESDVALTGADEDQCVHAHLTGSGTRDQLRLPLKYADTTELVDTNVGYDMQFTKTPISPSSLFLENHEFYRLQYHSSIKCVRQSQIVWPAYKSTRTKFRRERRRHDGALQ